MNNINLTFYNKLNIKTFKRLINNEHLKATLIDMSQNRKFNIEGKSKVEVNEALSKLELKQNMKQDPIMYDDIIKNLQESEFYLNNVKDKLKIAKEKHLNITIELKDNEKNIKNIKLDGLNKELKNIRDINTDDEIILNNSKIITDKMEIYQEKISNVKKGLFDFEWLNVIIDFMKSHSSLILTISSGLIIGGMWYVNSRGIDLGAMLGRLGLSIYSNFSGNTMSHSNISNTNIELPSSVSSTTQNQVAVTAHGFFRQLGVKILEILDIYIEKMKDKRQKY